MNNVGKNDSGLACGSIKNSQYLKLKFSGQKKPSILDAIDALTCDLSLRGPWLTEWPNYGKIEEGKNECFHHCHLKKGKPTYVACWKVIDEKAKKIDDFMSAHMKALRTERQAYCQVVITTPTTKKMSYQISFSHINELEALLKKYSEDDDVPIAWDVLAKERIEKHKKAGLVLRGMRYRENLSQRQLAQKSHVSQNEISKIENGKRSVGEKVARKLASALNMDYRLLIIN